ncbi:MAG: hypothetical protein JWL92_117 [Candidatus Nomurabacteria bacterium]|nr:hypothetical protein [Candidatus Nomurabacteria bacterium]
MKETLFVIGHVSNGFGTAFPSWRFETRIVTDSALLEEMCWDTYPRPSDLPIHVYWTLRRNPEKIFILEFNSTQGKIVRDDLLKEIVERRKIVPASPLETKVIDLDFSIRALNGLEKQGIKNLQELANRIVSEDGITYLPIKAKNIGKKTSNEYFYMLAQYGLLNCGLPDKSTFL